MSIHGRYLRPVAILCVIFSAGLLWGVAHADTKTSVSDNLSAIGTLSSELSNIPTPNIEDPAWLVEKKSQKAATQKRVVTYDVTTRGVITANIAEFKSQANQTLNDARGWAQLGVRFNEVASGGDFTLMLAQADQLPLISSGCDAMYSCNVGRYVIINQDRWLGATSSWNQGGGSLRDYRHMVINHETGHWLGHGHEGCPATGQPAPVMMQQSINLGGCLSNPWPLKSELWSSTLGVNR
ncbi:MAG TPA: DUF3152 domain-containing protein [Candidatus Saccharimonadales bacterium]|nr:DUF3152 domain-containing protein [Candidatus Saccharimonadales bacterium]